MKIKNINAKSIPDSRGKATIKCQLILENNKTFCASIPGGISTSRYEAYSQPVERAINAIKTIIAPALINKQPSLIETDIIFQSLIKNHLIGKQATLPVSIAIGRAESFCKQISFYELMQEIIGKKSFSVAKREATIKFLFNVLHGGVHATNKIIFQEILLMPATSSPVESLQQGKKLQQEIVKAIGRKLYATDKTNIPCWPNGKTGHPLQSHVAALDFVMEVIEKTGYDVTIGIDVAASQFYNQKSGAYFFQNKRQTSNEMINYYQNLVAQYPIFFIEDSLAPDDWKGWKMLTKALGSSVQIVGEDLFASDAKRIKQGMDEKAANGVVIKPGQTATVSQLLDSARICKQNNFDIITSPRSRETTDVFVSELSVAIGAKQFKTIACHCDYHAKKNIFFTQLFI